MRTKEIPIEVEANCFGYYGFGSGYDLGKNKISFKDAPKIGPNELYCNKCPLNEECWNIHRKRVNKLFPAIAEIIEEIMAQGLCGADYMNAIKIRLGNVEPYLSVMTGNIQDGLLISNGEPPTDRKNCTLTWPLQPLPNEIKES